MTSLFLTVLRANTCCTDCGGKAGGYVVMGDNQWEKEYRYCPPRYRCGKGILAAGRYISSHNFRYRVYSGSGFPCIPCACCIKGKRYFSVVTRKHA